ncbi:hypothetical protein G7Y89_g4367 [Cudoniella acicularis]|uniref:Nephrocystin 3-like N-terminal domain-containing protein n=1 Tax=Cudoniella acicularis TaxID=354080 RepID=A0A8H4RRK4_9HELO|nr:hypothetical protein G7Y89_g4367 [Cudoniella acicularis]
MKVSKGTGHRGWESFRKGLKAVWSNEKVDALSKKLERLRAELDSHVLLLLEARFGTLTIDQIASFKTLDGDLQPIIHSTMETNNMQNIEQREEFRKLAEILDTKTQTIINAVLEATTSRDDELRRQFIQNDGNIQTIIKVVLEATTIQKNKNPWNSFVEWLSSGSGTYWIQGKAASGKSTLMSFICDHVITRQSLEAWSPGNRLIVTSFFFWNSGNEGQRSHLGLLRSLLYTVLKDQTHLIPKVFPEEWERKTNSGLYERSDSQDEWSLPRLQGAFKYLIGLADQSCKFYFFIDGLDEYDGEAGEIADYFKDLSLCSDHAKFCLSSRPWPEFQNIFQASPGLRLQDLTHDDITSYVCDQLGNSVQMQQLLVEDPENSSWLIREIVDKASGVFLWVTLVVKALISGLRRGDEIIHLRRRLTFLPPGLETLYEHMLKSIDPLIEAKTTDFTFKQKIGVADWGYQTLSVDDYFTLTTSEPYMALVKELDDVLKVQLQGGLGV